MRLGRERFSWGRESLRDAGAMRQRYIAALRAADNHDMGPLLHSRGHRLHVEHVVAAGKPPNPGGGKTETSPQNLEPAAPSGNWNGATFFELLVDPSLLNAGFAVYTGIVYTEVVLGGVRGFDWDLHNVGHVARRGVNPSEVEEAVGRPHAIVPQKSWPARNGGSFSAHPRPDGIWS